jgi:tight adherence protein B
MRGFMNPLAAWRDRSEARVLERQLPLVAQVLAAHLRAGRSLRQAIADSPPDLPHPSAGRMAEARRALDLGGSPAQALRLLGGGDGVELIAAAVELQGQFGGNLAALFEGVAEAVYQRGELRRAAAVATAQARTTGRLVSGMPAVAIGALWLVDRPALVTLVQSPLGWAALGVSAAMVVTGHTLINRIAAVDP